LSSSKVFVSYQLATSSRPVAPTLTGFAGPPGFLNERPRCCAYWVSAKPLPLFLSIRDRNLIAPKLGIEAATRPPRPTLYVRAQSPLGLRLHSQSVTDTPPPWYALSSAFAHQRSFCFQTTGCPQSLPRFCPLQRFANRAEPQTPSAFPTRWSRCALRVSHPLDALLPTRSPGPISSRSRSWGLPFEALLPARCRTPSQTPSPSGFMKQPRLKTTPRPFRVSHTARSPNRRSWGLARIRRWCPRGLFSSEVSCLNLRWPAVRVTSHASPHVLLRPDVHAHRPAGTPGYFASGAAADLSRDPLNPLGILFLVDPLASLSVHCLADPKVRLAPR